MKIVQVVGYKNSGKTTLVEKIIRYGTMKGIQVGAIKHHGHGGPLEIGNGTDSVRHREAGAIVSTVQGDGEIQLLSNGLDWDLYKILDLYNFFNMDTVIVEGYKSESFPKVVLIKERNDMHLLNELTNVVGAIFWDPKMRIIDNEMPTFTIKEEESFLQWLWEEVLTNHGKDV